MYVSEKALLFEISFFSITFEKLNQITAPLIFRNNVPTSHTTIKITKKNHLVKKKIDILIYIKKKVTNMGFADAIFVNKILKDQTKTLFECIKIAFDKQNLTIEDKKRCCLLVNNFNLSHFNSKSRFSKDSQIQKYQWFHSAACIFIQLHRGKATNPFVRAVNDHPCMKEILIQIAKDILIEDKDGLYLINCVTDSEMTLCCIDDNNDSQVTIFDAI